MRRETVFVTLSVCITIVAASAIIARGGPLDPPPGPIQPTFKTLEEVEPRTAINQANTPGDATAVYRITEPGSYYLADNLQGEPGKHGILIASPGVTVNLNGFELVGGADSLNGVHVDTAGFPLNIVIRNGLLDSWQGDGVDASQAVGVQIEDVDVTFCIDTGFRVGESARISDCKVDFTGTGFRGGDNCTIERCDARTTTSTHGFEFGFGTTILDSAASDSAGVGIAVASGTIRNCDVRDCLGTGVFVSQHSVISGCSAVGNGVDGFELTLGGVIEHCVASQNDTRGILAGTRVLIDGCQATENVLSGITASSDCTVTNCNSTNNEGDGIFVGSNCVVTDCTVISNMDDGIEAVNIGNRIERNTCNFNQDLGIRSESEALVRENTCGTNAKGIVIDGRECLVERNRVANNTVSGIEVQHDRNLVVSNLARDNSGFNYVIVPGNRVGIIVIPPLSGDINGDVDADALGAGTTDPWANISY